MVTLLATVNILPALDADGEDVPLTEKMTGSNAVTYVELSLSRKHSDSERRQTHL